LVDPSTLIGDRLLGVTVGWHVHGANRVAVQYFLRFENATDLQVHPAGDGSITLLAQTAPADFEMDDYGRFEFRELDFESPLAAMLGKAVVRVDRLQWQGHDCGLRLHADGAVVVMANEGDETFVSNGDLPPDYEDASI